MNPFSDTQEIASRFGDSIEDLHDVFRGNGVDFGLPEDFFAFARTMKYHSELRDDVARVAKFLMQNETGVSLRTIVTIIAVASGGPEVATSDREMTSPVNLVIDSLISAGVCGRFVADDLDLPCSDPVATDFGSSNTLAESLTRLEMGSLQLKTYLDSIDERINRIEPRLKNVSASPVQSVSPSHASDEARARFSEISAVTELPSNGDGLYRAGERDRPPVVATRVGMDFRRFYFFRRQIALLVLVGIATLLLAVSFAWRVGHRVDNAAVLSPLKASVGDGGVDGHSLPAHAVSSGSDSRVAPVREKKSAQIHFTSPSPKSSFRAGPKVSPVAAAETSESTVSPDRTSRLSSEEGSNHLVNVSAGVMEANLVSGPKPSYPVLASLAHMQGNVVLQAVISKDGTVEHLQVVQGHRLLRGAAKNAVRNWRYRPYKVDGVPVEVATTVTVDFNLHH